MEIVEDEKSLELESTSAQTILDEMLRKELGVVAFAAKSQSEVYSSLQKTDRVFASQYGERALFELFQNAHDAHPAEGNGEVWIRLEIVDERSGTLYVANRGRGFEKENVIALRNLAQSSKNVGDGIGNKGLGFRSTETLSDDPRIYSQRDARPSDGFDGFCFRFLSAAEVAEKLQAMGLTQNLLEHAAGSVPKYLMASPILDQPEAIRDFAREGFATVIELPLTSAATIASADRQIRALLDTEAPLVLFLDRLDAVRLTVTGSGLDFDRRLQRLTGSEFNIGVAGLSCRRVIIDGAGEFLVGRTTVPNAVLVDAVRASIDSAPTLTGWLQWRGDAVVSVAIRLAREQDKGRLYNFIPMSKDASSPMPAHVSAPFFSDVDRRDADLDIPINALLLKYAAELCVGMATAAASNTPAVYLRDTSCFRVILWRDRLPVLITAFEEAGIPFRKAELIPLLSARGRRRYGNFEEVVLWDDDLTVFNATRAVTICGASIISPALHKSDLEGISAVATHLGRPSLLPTEENLCSWVEAMAIHLSGDKATSYARWSVFYREVVALFTFAKCKMVALTGRRMLLERRKLLGICGPDGRGALPHIAVERQARDNLLPPASISRRLRFLDEHLDLPENVIRNFKDNGLVSEFDAVNMLASLPSVLDPKRISSRVWADILEWVFTVWRHDPRRAEPLLKAVPLRVPTSQAWIKPQEASFSARWTAMGAILEEFLYETAGISPDCAEQQNVLLRPVEEWPIAIKDGQKTAWREFLELLGVHDGLRAVATDELRRESGYVWNDVLTIGRPDIGLDANWVSAVSEKRVGYASSLYIRDGRLWRLPGQLEYANLSRAARERFSRLVVSYLENEGLKQMTFNIAKTTFNYRDPHALPTPIATFLRNTEWLQIEVRGETEFRCPRDAWATSNAKAKPPKFVACVSADLAEALLGHEQSGQTFFSGQIGLRDWSRPKEAIQRLASLSVCYEDLTRAELSTFRREYDRAWGEAASSNALLPAHLPLVVRTREGERSISRDDDALRIVVSDERSASSLQVLCDAGLSVLMVPEGSANGVVAMLVRGGIDAVVASDVQVTVVVDGDELFLDPMAPSIVEAFSWLPRVLRVAHETMAERLEKGVHVENLEARLRSIRLSRCREWHLLIDGEIRRPSGNWIAYGIADQDIPMLVVTEEGFEWDTFVCQVVPEIQRLLGGQVQSLERCLLRLRRQDGPIEAPSDDELAKATYFSVEAVRNFAAETGENVEYLRTVLAGLVGYFHGIEIGKGFLNDATLRTRAELAQRLDELGLPTSDEAQAFIRAVEEGAAPNRLQEEFRLDFGLYNQTLRRMNLTPLNDEEELQRQFDAYLSQIRKGHLLDALRESHYDDYRAGRSLAPYLAQKRFEFVSFNPAWLSECSSLTANLVEHRARECFAQEIGDCDPQTVLATYTKALNENRQTLGKMQAALVTLIAAWCARKGVGSPEWTTSFPPDLAGELQDTGLLDFDIIKEAEIPALLNRTGLWPSGMPTTLIPAEAGLSEDDMRRPDETRKLELEERSRLARSIQFGGEMLDTTAIDFITRFETIGKAALEARPDVFNSLETLSLKPYDVDGESRSHSRGARGGRVWSGDGQLTERQKTAFGMAGEWLAYRYLQEKHGSLVTEDSWVSSNRAAFIGGTGDDSKGYDFRVRDGSVDWLYEVKASPSEAFEIELTANEMEVADDARSDRRSRYRLLYVPNVTDPMRWTVHELPNPYSERGRKMYRIVRQASTRLRFDLAP